jgi:hypothetical protein
MRTFDYSPFYRATVGFDRVFDLLDSVAGQGNANGYPPYNIEKTGENAYKIVMAVAGFAESELNLTQKENELLVTGQTAPNAARRPCEGLGREARQRPAHDRAAARDPGREEAPRNRDRCRGAEAGPHPLIPTARRKTAVSREGAAGNRGALFRAPY